MVYGYARCSTNETKQDIDRQKRELKKMGVEDKNIYFEYESGAKTDRIQLNRLLSVAKDKDTIVTTEVSRLTRFRLISAKVTAIPTASAVLVNGKNISFDAYNINDNNYFKLRDLAYILNGAQKQFEVGWDGANNAISITSGKPYTTAAARWRARVPATWKRALQAREYTLMAKRLSLQPTISAATTILSSAT